MVSACSEDSARGPSPDVPSFTTSGAPTSQGERPVPRTCRGVASLDEVSDILGTAVTGQVLPIVGVPEPKIGRTARLDCYYGVPQGQQVSAAPVWIALASYADEEAARRRMTSTVDTEREAGVAVNDVPVGADRGVLLNGPNSRTLVAVRGRTTVVVTAIATLVPADQAGAALGRLADRSLTPR